LKNGEREREREIVSEGGLKIKREKERGREVGRVIDKEVEKEREG